MEAQIENGIEYITSAVHQLQILGYILTDGAAERADTNKVFDNMPQHQTAASRPLKLYL